MEQLTLEKVFFDTGSGSLQCIGIYKDKQGEVSFFRGLLLYIDPKKMAGEGNHAFEHFSHVRAVLRFEYVMPKTSRYV
jgi:hypothetical protein